MTIQNNIIGQPVNLHHLLPPAGGLILLPHTNTLLPEHQALLGNYVNWTMMEEGPGLTAAEEESTQREEELELIWQKDKGWTGVPVPMVGEEVEELHALKPKPTF